ncbi:MAG: hypothetical protein JWR80_1045 [Bradyrhizobium sp.]|nr:hypothetical protein [Bradyrhizobium sp.]
MSGAAIDLFEIPAAANQNSTSLLKDQNVENFKFEREDWMLFRSLETLPQKAGVSLHRLRRLALKEIVDNALDAAGAASIKQIGDIYVVEDDGPGMDAEPEAIARTFSIRRPMESSKMWRLPVRGALGNGLRVVAGAVLASNGSLTVTTKGWRHALVPQNDGSTAVSSAPHDRVNGTRIEISFGANMPADRDAMSWGELAIRAAQGKTYGGTPSPFWYSADHFFEMLQAAGGRPVRSIIERLDGCTGGRAGQICSTYRAMPAAALDRGQAVALLGAARAHAKQVNPSRLGSVGADAFGGFYASQTGSIEVGTSSPKAIIPFIIEAWAEWLGSDKDKVWLDLLVNRTPVTGEPRGRKEKKTISLFGCGLSHQFEAERGAYRIIINIIAPYVPITTDGKEPDLKPFLPAIIDVVHAAIKKAKRAAPKVKAKRSQKEVVLEHLDFAIAKNSAGGTIRFGLRNLWYVVGEFVMPELGSKLDYNYFQKVITDYENNFGDIAGMTRDPRGTLYHPHTGESIPIGTRTVEDYERPKWTFKNVLFIEKEGFFETLKVAKWPEKYDCALLTSKGYGSRAAKDLIDMLADDADEDVRVFCVHDADAYGTMIYQTLQEATSARDRRRIEIINFGLEPWEAMQMGLTAEDRDKDAKDAPVADYVKNRLDDTDWAEWLQRQRFELNAMTMPQFMEWLDGKMIEHGVTKVVPPVDVIREAVRDEVESEVRLNLTDRILEEADLEGQVENTMAQLVVPSDQTIEAEIPLYLKENPTDRWKTWANLTAMEISQAA